MFKKMIKAVVLSAALVAGGIGTLAVTASSSNQAAAQSIELRFGNGHAPRYRQGGRHFAPNFCDPRHALGKAQSMGIRRAHVVRNAPRRVAVAGFQRGQQVRVVFANQRGCPVIGYR
ncbi:hypothetical protein [Rhizobium sp. EC-SD404]|uniref:hypothetical protein n=1 Tax=Rhizobium sp. EC-SD404 TaxID=2038389 RepID=UPI0012598DAB|nr:hypothetical protein [Rhizobium sp. EC-SD404]VVT27025.1 conserved hypothetical protein [Rhizobium sp. EC-SD404]